MSQDHSRSALRAAWALSGGIALVMSVGFFLLTTFTGSYNDLTRYGGAAWVLLLSLIIALPVLTPLIKRRHRQ
ncbi:MAG: hypothetical protein HYY32_01355 [Chloroflexi bacterium]|nr:hypothetical protein [Chloroflexota bacterium]